MNLQQSFDRRALLLEERITLERAEVRACYDRLQSNANDLRLDKVDESTFSPSVLRDRASWVTYYVSKLNDALTRLETLEAQRDLLTKIRESAVEV